MNFPDVLLIANKYQISVPAPFVPGSEFAGVIVETGDGVEPVSRSATGSPAPACTVHSPRGRRPRHAALARIPDGVDDRTAAASAWRTARRITRCDR